MHSPTERPLTPWAKTGLIVSTAAIIILFYAFTLIAAVTLLLILAVEFVLVLALLRIGLAGWMAAIMGTHLRLVRILFRNLWLRSNSVQYSIALQQSDAPALFEILNSLAGRFQLPVPDEVQLEMAVNAWVQLKGLRSGNGMTKLGIGYDLLSGLTVSEFEAVLAHEMAHAKLVQRGFKLVATGAVIRCGLLMNALTNEVREGRGTKDSRQLAEMFRNATDLVIRTLARLVAAYSRQDEFEADRGAAMFVAPARSVPRSKNFQLSVKPRRAFPGANASHASNPAKVSANGSRRNSPQNSLPTNRSRKTFSTNTPHIHLWSIASRRCRPKLRRKATALSPSASSPTQTPPPKDSSRKSNASARSKKPKTVEPFPNGLAGRIANKKAAVCNCSPP